MTNIINLSDRRPKRASVEDTASDSPKGLVTPDPWLHAQPSLVTKSSDRDELWSHPYFGISFMIWATGSHDIPEPPTTGGSPAAANVATYQRLRAVA